jgi:FecR protein
MTTRTGPPHSEVQGTDSDEILRAFVEQPVSPMPAHEADALRNRVTRALEGGHARGRVIRPATDRWRPWLLFAAAASLPVAIWGASTRLHMGGERPPSEAFVTAVGAAAIVRGDAERSIAGVASAALREGDELRTSAAGGARATLPTGATVDVGPSARLRFRASGAATSTRDHLELVEGRVQLQVPKLAAGDDLRVQTVGAVVIVHGTKFAVEHVMAVGASCAETRVSVTEGVVGVEWSGGERKLTMGMSLVVPDVPPALTAAPTPSSALDPAVESPPVETSASTPSSTLAAENALLAEAMTSRRDHQDERALARLDRLLTRYPASPLAETARVERLRVLEETGALGRLGHEAERYLADYPRGFGRAEASRLLAEARTSAP